VVNIVKSYGIRGDRKELGAAKNSLTPEQFL
jgi:hypothetical protein